ncbi:hypothetical protein BSKO_07718 [Bryopsis sp. KO-2023]|nr:hypothetical protein BSKO_04449 [Bryopsis sp. KO-2023]GMH39819.1 hypothetical protein BSKO_07717 [Bryopsis sp. KO-2023]GMH39820.1 hypothetical protein BSKO_07718 [Bryopsis sp. KO-2023]
MGPPQVRSNWARKSVWLGLSKKPRVPRSSDDDSVHGAHGVKGRSQALGMEGVPSSGERQSSSTEGVLCLEEPLKVMPEKKRAPQLKGGPWMDMEQGHLPQRFQNGYW